MLPLRRGVQAFGNAADQATFCYTTIRYSHYGLDLKRTPASLCAKGLVASFCKYWGVAELCSGET